MARWRVRLGSDAERDYSGIIDYTTDTFGPRQSNLYQTTLKKALTALRAGPDLRDSVARDEIETGLRSLHVARNGRRGRHWIMYRAAPERTIEVLRILHDAKDIAGHFPPRG